MKNIHLSNRDTYNDHRKQISRIQFLPFQEQKRTFEENFKIHLE